MINKIMENKNGIRLLDDLDLNEVNGGLSKGDITGISVGLTIVGLTIIVAALSPQIKKRIDDSKMAKSYGVEAKDLYDEKGNRLANAELRAIHDEKYATNLPVENSNGNI